jgi:hypothetical protein
VASASSSGPLGPPSQRQPAALDPVAEPREHRGQDGHRGRHRGRHHEDDGQRVRPVPRVLGHQHAGHRADHRDPGDQDGAAGGRRRGEDRRVVVAPRGSLFARPAQIEERVVDTHGQADQQRDGVDRLVEGDDLARERDQAERRHHGGDAEQQRDERGDDRPEGDGEDDERDRQRRQLGFLEVLADPLVDRLLDAGVAGLRDAHVRVLALHGGDNRLSVTDTFGGRVDRARDVEGDQCRVALRHGRMDRVEPLAQIGHGRPQRGRVVALHEHALARRLREAGLVQRAVGARGLADVRLAERQLLGPERAADGDDRDDEREPAEDGAPPVPHAPACGSGGHVAAPGGRCGRECHGDHDAGRSARCHEAAVPSAVGTSRPMTAGPRAWTMAPWPR